jgi:predicted peptidase
MRRDFLSLFAPLFFFLISICVSNGWANTFYGTVQTGLFQLNESAQPVYLYVPEHYKDSKTYPLIISIPGSGESPEAMLQEWVSIAKRKSYIVLVPTFEQRDTDVPYNVDAWLIDLKQSILKRYQIAPQRIYLIGRNEGAHYAAYLAMKYPEQFSAVALLGGSWAGPFEKLMDIEKNPAKQIPFFVGLREADKPLLEKTIEKAYELEKNGYPVYLEKLQTDENFSSSEFKNKLLQWLEEKSLDWQKIIQGSRKTWQDKAGGWLQEQTKISEE